MPFTYEKQIARDGSEYIEITGLQSRQSRVSVPDALEGLPVRSIGSHAFAERSFLRELIVPASVKTLRSFAFYACHNLERLSLCDTTDDYYDGVIRQCTGLRQITIEGSGENFILMKQMLADVDMALRFRLLLGGKEIRLTFPEYVSEAREDTMARAIHFSTWGSGIAYRECVTKKNIDLTGYDRLLPRLTDDDFESAAEIALDRLMFPEGLLAPAEKQYRDFVRERPARVLKLLIEQEDVQAVSFLSAEGLIGKAALEPSLLLASRLGESEICAVLMEEQKKYGSGGTVLTLGDFDF